MLGETMSSHRGERRRSPSVLRLLKRARARGRASGTGSVRASYLLDALRFSLARAFHSAPIVSSVLTELAQRQDRQRHLGHSGSEAGGSNQELMDHGALISLVQRRSVFDADSVWVSYGD